MHNILAFLNNIKEDFKWNKENKKANPNDMEESDVFDGEAEEVEEIEEEKKELTQA